MLVEDTQVIRSPLRWETQLITSKCENNLPKKNTGIEMITRVFWYTFFNGSMSHVEISVM